MKIIELSCCSFAPNGPRFPRPRPFTAEYSEITPIFKPRFFVISSLGRTTLPEYDSGIDFDIAHR